MTKIDNFGTLEIIKIFALLLIVGGIMAWDMGKHSTGLIMAGLGLIIGDFSAMEVTWKNPIIGVVIGGVGFVLIAIGVFISGAIVTDPGIP